VVRRIFNSELSLLVVATFIWGGCVSCEQFFMFPGTQQKCCNKSGQCERPGKSSPKPDVRDCNRLALDRGGDLHVLTPPALLPAIIAVDDLRPTVAFFPAEMFEALPDPSPPDRQALNSTFLI